MKKLFIYLVRGLAWISYVIAASSGIMFLLTLLMSLCSIFANWKFLYQLGNPWVATLEFFGISIGFEIGYYIFTELEKSLT